VRERAEVDAQVQRILSSSEFANSIRCTRFLRYCVDQYLDGNEEVIKETVLGVEVFDRTPGYDPKADPIVRVYAHRVRQKLGHYYSVIGQADAIRISLPKGHYVPEIKALVSESAADIDDAGTLLSEGEVHPTTRNRTVWYMAGCLIALTLCSYIVHVLIRSPIVPADAATGEPLPLITLSGKSTDPALSSDGNAIAFSWSEGADSPRIYWQRLGESQAHEVTNGKTADVNPVWSPDGKEIAFIQYSGGNQFDVVRASISTQERHVIGQFPYFSSLCCSLPALDWSPDGRHMLVGEQASYLAPIRLLLVDLKSSNQQILTSPPAGTTGDVEGKFSPDGTRVAFHRGGRGDLYVVDTMDEAKLKLRPLTVDNQGVKGIAWAPDGKSILYGSNRDATGYGIWSIPATGGQPKRITPKGFQAALPSVSRVTGNTVFVHEDYDANLVEIPLPGQASSYKQEHPLTLAPSTRFDGQPAYSPDGRWIAFISTRTGPPQLWMTEASGRGLKQLTHLEAGSLPLTPSWAPDQRSIVFSVRRDGLTNVFSCDVASGKVTQLTFSSNRYFSPLYSRDGKYLFISSNAEGASRIWRIPTNNYADPQPLYWDGALQFQLSQDGRFVYFPLVDNGLRIQERNLQTGATRTVFQTHEVPYFMMGMLLRNNVLYIPVSDDLRHAWIDLLAVNVRDGSSSILLRLPSTGDCLFPNIDVAPDQRSVVFTKIMHKASSIYSIASMEAKTTKPMGNLLK
jgi:Tol biopolymer transport system component